MDLKLVMTNDGGDLVLGTKDLLLVFGIENMPLLGLFGGNVEESTPSTRLTNKFYYDWWGNNLLFPNDTSKQFNSETERILNNIALNSAGMVRIEEAVKRDLKFLNEYAKVQVEVRLLELDRILIGIKIAQKVIVYIWDATNKTLVEPYALINNSGISPSGGIFADEFAFEFE